MSWTNLAPWRTQDQTEDEKPTPSQSYNQENAPCRSMRQSSSSNVNEPNKILLAIYSCGRLLYKTASAVLPSFIFFGSTPEQQRDEPLQLQHDEQIVEQCVADKNNRASIHNDDLSKGREELTESLNSALSHDSQLLKELDQCDFVYDVMAGPPGKNQLRRCMMLSFHADTDIMSKEAHQRLGTSIEPYQGAPIPVLGLQDSKPVGIAEVQWSFCGRSKPYRTAFYVVEDVEYDLLIGRPSMRQHELYRVDPAIAERLRDSYRRQ
ncbi:cellulase family protein [Aspergillus niger]|uniref:uncharacterized protein n=1 Tax=Aspergillus lacticoffeatus (strain CBS 101883) TaxID=1450533 RepID=UPI000D804952|nr:uncharacterized protein BO96DRAFT_447120 [Aspergillus niger CBS 101883]PYH55747.1 hypothetical protein BO96DRAFT_447120 [Aspergillus niger CBS 101883]GJP96709.1 cellulase family protein [Aspergillus niger]